MTADISIGRPHRDKGSMVTRRRALYQGRDGCGVRPVAALIQRGVMDHRVGPFYACTGSSAY